MRINLLLSAGLAGICLLMSCQEDATVEPVPVTFSLRAYSAGPSRAGTDSASSEAEVHRWALLLFRDGQFVDYGLSSSQGPITRTLQKGVYTAYAVANYPEALFHPETFRVTEDLTEGTVDLADNATDAPVMVGQTHITVPDEGNGTLEITVERLVCKTGISGISVDFTDPTLVAQTFVLKSIFLTNCCGINRYGTDFSLEELPADKPRWYNPMGLSGNGFPALLDIDTAITPSTPYRTPHSFLYYPNPTGADKDTHAKTWSLRCTRMVIEAEIGNRVCYYPITLPAIERNQTCMVEEVIIRRAGSDDPEQLIPDAVEIVFSTSVHEWERQNHEKDAY